MNVETAQRLANLRRSKGYSQEGLARKLGLSRQAVSKWERAESSPDTENLISLAKLYGVSLDDLLNPSDEIEDDIEFENEDRARQREEEATERARTHEAAARATEAATQASDAAAKAAQAASWSAQAANAATARATAQVNGVSPTGAPTGAVPPAKQAKGPFQSFPYWAVCWILFILLFFAFGCGPISVLIFFTIPIYKWVVRALDDDWARGNIAVGAAPAAVQGHSAREDACSGAAPAQGQGTGTYQGAAPVYGQTPYAPNATVGESDSDTSGESDEDSPTPYASNATVSESERGDAQ